MDREGGDPKHRTVAEISSCLEAVAPSEAALKIDRALPGTVYRSLLLREAAAPPGLTNDGDAAEEPEAPPPPEPLKRLLVQDGQRGFFLTLDAVQWIEADRHFVRLHLAHGRCHRIRVHISALYERLDHSQFLRVNRSAIVNIDFVSELRPRNRYDSMVLLRDGTVLSFSRLYRNCFKRGGAVYGSGDPA